MSNNKAGIYPGFDTCTPKDICFNFHTPKPMILYYFYGKLPKFSYRLRILESCIGFAYISLKTLLVLVEMIFDFMLH